VRSNGESSCASLQVLQSSPRFWGGDPPKSADENVPDDPDEWCGDEAGEVGLHAEREKEMSHAIEQHRQSEEPEREDRDRDASPETERGYDPNDDPRHIEPDEPLAAPRGKPQQFREPIVEARRELLSEMERLADDPDDH